MYEKSGTIPDSAKRCDPDAYKDNWNFPIEIFGELKNRLSDPNNNTMYVRGIKELWYFPESET